MASIVKNNKVIGLALKCLLFEKIERLSRLKRGENKKLRRIIMVKKATFLSGAFGVSKTFGEKYDEIFDKNHGMHTKTYTMP